MILLLYVDKIICYTLKIEIARSAYNNGILEIAFKKKEGKQKERQFV